ncbi:hypothetical protein ANCCAN_05927 [Ancylostoma caninum]|uniref:Uncharacterized protein n=1 Tax=Ancylostoma caninum TaxID=29170 RepID=A0A368GWP6_ANCCA|nr:hypothetical protein ANCCAN_05927 [Ancylostoma caninum]
MLILSKTWQTTAVKRQLETLESSTLSLKSLCRILMWCTFA